MAITMITNNGVTMISNPRQEVLAAKRNRVKLFVLVRILFQYLEKVDPSTLNLAKKILVDCERKLNAKDCQQHSTADAIEDRLRDVVGEAHWSHARKIQKQLMINNQKRKIKAMKKRRA